MRQKKSGRNEAKLLSSLQLRGGAGGRAPRGLENFYQNSHEIVNFQVSTE